jgi:hypothetical protein
MASNHSAKDGEKMAEEAKREKKKVYVETTIVSDATALPTNDLTLAGRQMATREWWKTAAERFDLFVSPIVRREAAKGDADAANRRLEALSSFPELELTLEVSELAQTHDATLEEMWRIKEELSTAHDTWEEYIADILAFQEEERKRGVKFVRFPSRKPELAMA